MSDTQENNENAPKQESSFGGSIGGFIDKITDSAKDLWQKAVQMWHDTFTKVTDTVKDITWHVTSKITSIPKAIGDFYESKKETLQDFGKWTLYVGTFRRVLDGGVYAGKKTKQQIELAYSNAMKDLHEKLKIINRDQKIQEVKQEDISFFGTDGLFFYTDKDTGISTKTDIVKWEWSTISQEEFNQEKDKVLKD